MGEPLEPAPFGMKRGTAGWTARAGSREMLSPSPDVDAGPGVPNS